MTDAPPPEVLAAINAPNTRVIRRCEIYEADGVTRWPGDTGVTLVDFTVGADYSRDERRTLDLVLDNSDGQLETAPHGFWYDKIIKMFRGASIRQKNRPPKVIIIGDYSNSYAAPFRALLASRDFDNVRINTIAASLDDLKGYEIVVSLGNDNALPQTALLKQAYAAGFAVFTLSTLATHLDLPFVTTDSATAAGSSLSINPNLSAPGPLEAGWIAEACDVPAGGVRLITALRAGAIPVSVTSVGAANGFSLVAEVNPNGLGGKWFHSQVQIGASENFTNLLRTAFSWLNPFVPIAAWETQVGEFMIDRISQDNFPQQVKVTGRDYTKKCLNSCFTQATQFDPGSKLEDLIAAISANAGITKKVLPVTGIVVGKVFTYERGTSRWAAMKEIANSYNYDIYFDLEGYLRMQEAQDPVLSPIVHTFSTGPAGNMATYTKSTNDSRIYNHVLVTGDTSDTSVLPPWAEAINNNPASPTSVAALGDRLYEYSSSFIETHAQAQAVADSFLAIHALEEFQFDFTSLVFAWLDVGNIVQILDPRPSAGDPVRFLLSSISIPSLGLMTATAKRITVLS